MPRAWKWKRGWWKEWRQWFRWHGALTRMRAEPERVARGFAIGLFIGMLPGTGLPAALVVAFACRLYKPGVILGAVMTNPVTAPILYLLSYHLGSRLMGSESSFEWQGWRKLQWGELLYAAWPTLLGTVIIGTVVAACGYILVYVLLRCARSRPPRAE